MFDFFSEGFKRFRYFLFKFKNFRIILEHIPFFFKKCSFNPEEFEYADSLENYYLYNETIGFFYEKLSDFLMKPWEVGMNRNRLLGWYRSTFTWLRYLTSYRSVKFLKNFILVFFDKPFWCFFNNFSLYDLYDVVLKFLIEFFDELNY